MSKIVIIFTHERDDKMNEPMNTLSSAIDSEIKLSSSQIIKRYISLTKPRVVILLAITGIFSFIIGARGNVTIFDIIMALYIGYASSGGAMVMNSYFDRDIDILMPRTAKRPSVSSPPITPPEKMLLVGTILVSSAIILAYFVFNLLTAVFVAWGVVSYLIIYTLYLKRRSVWNTVIGGLTASTPVLVGFAAALGKDVGIEGLFQLPLESWLLAVLLFLWNPSHTWTLATKYLEDYARADIPMLPVVHGEKFTAQVVFVMSIVLIIDSLVIAGLITNWNLLVFLLLVYPNYKLFVTSWAFLKVPSRVNGIKSFVAHNIWLALVFIIYALHVLVVNILGFPIPNLTFSF